MFLVDRANTGCDRSQGQINPTLSEFYLKCVLFRFFRDLISLIIGKIETVSGMLILPSAPSSYAWCKSKLPVKVQI